jgi:hypothetical protein
MTAKHVNPTLSAILLLLSFLTAPLLAQTQPPPPATDAPTHDISMVDPAPLGGAIAVPLPPWEKKRMSRYEIPELVGSRQALGSQLIGGQLPRPILDFILTEGSVEQRLSIFEGSLVVIDVRGAGGTIRKKVIIPDDALATYRKRISPTALAMVRPGDLTAPIEGRRAMLRVYAADHGYVERLFDPLSTLPKRMSDQIMPLQDLLRAIYEDRTVTNTVAGYMPKVGDQLVADDRKVYEVRRIIDKQIVELRCLNQPMTIYVAVKDLYNYFVGTTGAARQ